MSMSFSPLAVVVRGRQARQQQRRRIIVLLLALLASAFALSLMLGQSYTPPAEVMRILFAQDVSGGDAFAVGQLRLPRAFLAVLAGLSFGLAGAAFQIMLRNPLASPDIIGINLGASAAAVFAIVVLQLNGPAVSAFAVAAGLGVALLTYGLSFRNGPSGTRLILVGIGVAAIMESFIAYTLSQAPAWNLQEAMRWLSGSVNGAQLRQAIPLAVALATFGGLLLSRGRDLDTLKLGDDAAAAVGTNVAMTRITVMMAAVGMVAVATAVTGPISFVAFLSGSIATRMTGGNGSQLIPSALVGAILVLAGDYIGQHLLPGRYPVGVVTGALGGPYLLYLIIRVNRSGGSL